MDRPAFIVGASTLVLGLILFALYLRDAFKQDRIARAVRECDIETPAPAPDSPARVPARDLANLAECYRKGHVYPDWARTDTHWICVRCGDAVALLREDLPFDQDAAQLVAEVDAFLTRRTA